YRKLLDAARGAPGIESATLAEKVPLGFLDTPPRRAAVESYEPRRGEDLAFMWNPVASDYFRTLRIPLLAGREFEDRDDATAMPSAIVNATLAHRFWGGAANAIGKRIRFADGDWRSVVGVVADVKYARIDESPRPFIYVPFFQSYRGNMVLHTRGTSTAAAAGASVDRLVEQARALGASLGPPLPIVSPRRLSAMLREPAGLATP